MNSQRTAWLLISPTILILVLVGLVPFLYVLYVGFFNWMPLGKVKDMQFINFGYNYRELMFDEYFLESIWRSIQFSVTTLFFELSIGFLLALSLECPHFPRFAIYLLQLPSRKMYRRRPNPEEYL